MFNVSVAAFGRIPVQKQNALTLRQMGAHVGRQAIESAAAEPDAVFVGNLMSDELQGQKHLASLIASEIGLRYVTAHTVRAASASGAAALQAGWIAVRSGAVRRALVIGVEKMHDYAGATAALAKSLDAEQEQNQTLLSINAQLMQTYIDQYRVSAEAFTHFPLTAHANARHNPIAIFQDKTVTADMITNSRVVDRPMRLYDASPICEGAAAVLLVRSDEAGEMTDQPIRFAAATCATDIFRVADRDDPLALAASGVSAHKALHAANLTLDDIDFFELHDAFSIMSVLQLESVGFAERGEGWRMGVEGAIGLNGRIPISTLGGLKARGHPIGATAIYQAIEIMLQLRGDAGQNQLPDPRAALMQSVGGAGSTIFTQLFTT